MLAFLPPSRAAEQVSAVDDFISSYRCMIVEHLLALHEHGSPSVEKDRYFILAMTNRPQRYVQCIFHDIDTALYCEASSGRYGPEPGKPHALSISEDSAAKLKHLGFTEPYGVTNYSREFALGNPPDFREVADVLLRSFFDVYYARLSTPMDLSAPLLGSGKTLFKPCRPMS
jgi:hypothetical protein